MKDDASQMEIFEELAALRARFALQHAFDGFKIENERALQLLKNIDDNTLTDLDKAKRDRLVAAVENLVDFSVAEEYHLMSDAQSLLDEYGDIDFNDEEMMEEFEDLCKKYNDTYASVENQDIEYAMGVAYQWIYLANDVYLTYMTQNDDRVRPWHFALQGFTARKSEFPQWMIPPIEWRCRCFLESSDGGIYAKDERLKQVQAKAPVKPKELDDVFSESIAKCGRIFGKSHPYFTVDKSDAKQLKKIAKNIKKTYYGEKE